MGLLRVPVVCGVALLCSVVMPALAQEADEDVSPSIFTDQPVVIPKAEEPPPPRRRPRAVVDPYAPQGFGDGVFKFLPRLEIGGVYTNNVTASPTNRKSDAGLRLRPSLSFETNWVRHSWRGTASAEWLHYLATPNVDSLTGSASTDFRLDILRGTTADFSATFTANQSGTGNAEVPGNAISPRRDQNFQASAGVTQDFGSWEGKAKTQISRSTFDDVALSGGGTENNADRNYWEPSLTLRGTYGHSGMPLRPYAEVTYAPRFHDLTVDRNGLRRNSQGGSLAVGVLFDDGPIWTGDVSANFIARRYDDPALQTAMALGLNGSITWSPTPLFNVVAATGVSLSESAQAGVSATQNWTASLNATYEVHENIKLRAGASVNLAKANAALDTTTTVSAGAEWQVNPYMAVNGTVQSTWFNASTPGSSYDDQRVIAGIVLQK